MKKPLNRILSKRGISSRTQADALIRAGKVRVGGQVIRDPLRAFELERTDIQIDGAEPTRQAPLTIAFHKPKGTVVTRSDEKGRPTVFDLLENLPNLVAVGRLDLATTGLLILTNDTEFSGWVTDPKNSIPRVYVVTVRGNVAEETVQRLVQGIDEKGELLQAEQIEIIKASNRETHLKVTLTEGKNREIRRMFKHLEHEVTRLKRISFGGIELGTTAPGKWRELSQADLASAFPNAPLRLKKRLELFDYLLENSVPHRISAIRAGRRSRHPKKLG